MPSNQFALRSGCAKRLGLLTMAPRPVAGESVALTGVAVKVSPDSDLNTALVAAGWATQWNLSLPWAAAPRTATRGWIALRFSQL